MSIRLTFWGVRGSIPVPGPTTVKYGGNTSCLELRFGDRGPADRHRPGLRHPRAGRPRS